MKGLRRKVAHILVAACFMATLLPIGVAFGKDSFMDDYPLIYGAQDGRLESLDKLSTSYTKYDSREEEENVRGKKSVSREQPTQLTLSKTQLHFSKRGKSNVIAYIHYKDKSKEDVTKKVEWTSSNTSIVDVKDGKIEVFDEGRAIITASYLDFQVNLHVSVNFSDEVLWEFMYDKGLNEEAFSGSPTSDGGFIVLGISRGWKSDELFALKVKKNGAFEWEKKIAMKGKESPRTIRLTSDGGYVMLSNSEGRKGRTIILRKLNVNGSVRWSKEFPLTGKYWGGYVEQTKDDGYILATGEAIIKLDKSGREKWKTNIKNGADLVRQTSDEGYYVLGNYVTKVNQSGKTLWTKDVGQILTFMDITNDGGIVTYAEDGVVKVDEKGKIKWRRTIEGPPYDKNQRIAGVIQASDGSYIVATNAFIFKDNTQVTILYKLDEKGKVIWEKHFGFDNGEWVNEVRETKEGEYVLVGKARSDLNGEDVYLLRVKPDKGQKIVKTVQFSGKNGLLKIGETFQIKATATYTDGKKEDVSTKMNIKVWGDDGRVYSLEDNKIKALYPGSILIIGQYKGHTVRKGLIVSDRPPTRLQLEKEDRDLRIGDSQSVMLYADLGDKYLRPAAAYAEWRVSNEDVIEIIHGVDLSIHSTDEIIIEAKKRGTVMITVTYAGETLQFPVTVK